MAKDGLHMSRYSLLLPLPEKAGENRLLMNGVYGAYDVIPEEEAACLREDPALLPPASGFQPDRAAGGVSGDCRPKRQRQEYGDAAAAGV